MSRDGIPQVVNYHVGVGVSGGVLDKVYGGISGEGWFVDILFWCCLLMVINFD
jgi:hypothetical protein